MTNQLSELLESKLLTDFEQNKLSEPLTEAIKYLANFSGQIFNPKLLQEVTLVFENCDQIIIEANEIAYFALKDTNVKSTANDFFCRDFYLLFTAKNALELMTRLKKYADLVYFEVKYLSGQRQRYFIFWDPRSNDPANNLAQYQEVYNNQVFLYSWTPKTFSFAEILPNITLERLYIILRVLLEKLPSKQLAEFEGLSEEARVKRYWRLLEFLDTSLDNLDEYSQKQTNQTKQAVIKVIQNQVVVEDTEIKTQALCFAKYEDLFGYRLQLNGDFWHEFALVLAEISFFGVDPDKRATNIAKFKQILPDVEQLYFYRQTDYLAHFLKTLPQNQAAVYQDLAQGYRQVNLENATLRMDFIGQDSDLLYAFITDYQQDFMNFIKVNEHDFKDRHS